MLFGKTSFLLSMAGFALLAAPETAPPPPAQISGVLAIPADPPAAGTAPTPAASAEDKRPAAVKNLVIARELNVTRWLQPGEYVWAEADAAAARGPATVIVNLRSRTLSVYRGGVELGRAHFLYGYGDHPTPLGTFPVREKKRDHHSRTYDAPMPHMLRLTDDGVALHGSQRLGDNLATHGCIGLPREFAALLFDQVGVGDQVTIWSGRADG